MQKEKNKYQSLRTRNPRDDDKLIALKLKLASVLELALAVEERARVPVEAVKILLKKLEAIMNEWYGNRKKHLIQDQMEWIWMYLIGYLTQLDDSCKKSGNLECFVTFTTQMRCMIYKLIKVEKARW